MMLSLKDFRSGNDVISGRRQTLRYVTFLALVSGVVTSTTSEATYLQYLSGTQHVRFLADDVHHVSEKRSATKFSITRRNLDQYS